MEQKNATLGWVDLLRIIACFFVMLSHACDPFVGAFDTDRAAFVSGAAVGSLVRSCVPLFVMMTGVLLLPLKLDMASFYKKRVTRIVIALAFWSVVLPFLYFVYVQFINPVTANPGIVWADHTFMATLKKCYTFIWNFNFDTIPLWYLYMLIGLYLVMPILNAWIVQATRQELLLFLRIWGFTLFLPLLKLFGPMLGYPGVFGNRGLLGVCDWNEFGTFYYVTGFIGYLVLAHYLVKYPLNWSWQKTLGICVPLFLLGYAITLGGFLAVQHYTPGNFPNFEVIWYFTGINVFMMTFAVFVLVQKINTAASPRLSKIASRTFGIYLCHFVFITVVYDGIGTSTAVPPVLRIVGIAAGTFMISYVLVWLMDKWPLTRRFVR